ncbi:MAG: hypothetical protein J3K34DRAFT_444075 [Monoraphidium minutum]|nr:MAG: hypothetical protein J3K34DRAFT_444075 [Monoraphidium minutum]
MLIRPAFSLPCLMLAAVAAFCSMRESCSVTRSAVLLTGNASASQALPTCGNACGRRCTLGPRVDRFQGPPLQF